MPAPDKRSSRLGIGNPRAPWRRAARPLVVLFVLQLSGIGCAARSPRIEPPSRPEDMRPYLTAYEDQIEEAGIAVADAEAYVVGHGPSPIAADERRGAAPAAASDGSVAAVSRSGRPRQATQEPGDTFKIIDGVPEYLIGSTDVLRVTTYLGPETPSAASFRVLADGTIFISRFNIGAVQAAGKTPTELTRELSTLFRRYVPSGYAEVRVEEHNAWTATLTGQIVDVVADGPGTYNLEGRVTVSDFIYGHGGPTPDAALGDVRLMRGGQEARVDVAGVLAGRVEDEPLRNGDIVHVPSIRQGDSVMFVFGEVRDPGVYPLSDNTSVLDAIAQAGGWTSSASRDAVYVSRPRTNEVIPVDLDVALSTGEAGNTPELIPGDFVVVPFQPDRSQRIRDYVGIFSLILSALTIIELVRRQ